MKARKRVYHKTSHRRGKFFYIFFIGCCITSILVHLFLFNKIQRLELGSFNPSSFDTIVPRRFHLERVKIDPAIIETVEEKKTDTVQRSVDLGPQQIENFSLETSLKNVNQKPEMIDNNQFLEEKPEVLNQNSMISKNSPRANQPLLSLDIGTKECSLEDISKNQPKSIPAYSGLDQLLEQKTPLSPQIAPILLPTDLLFEYNADQLKEEAQKSLKKLALLIQRNPKAQFIVEGFTDSFGSDEYNLDLSTRRANTIKEWLITKELINRNQIQAYGLGKTHFIVPSNGTIEQQSLNRRVEIVIHQSKNP